MSYDIFDYREMMGLLEKSFPPRVFLLDTFFPSVKTHETEHIDLDIKRRGRRLAAFVSATKEGKVVDRSGYEAKSFRPPYIKEKKVTTAEDVLKRQPGELIYATPLSPEERANRKLGEDLSDLRERQLRRICWMAAQLLLSGKVVCQGDGIDVTVDFGMSSDHVITLGAEDKWSVATSDPVGDLIDWKMIVSQDSGLVPDVAILGTDVAKAIRKNSLVMEQLNNRRVELGQINPQDLPNGVTYIGNLESVDLYSFDDWYEDDEGDLQPMVPSGKVILGSSKAENFMHYGAIKDLGCMAVTDFFPKSWVENDPSARFVMLQSAPIPGMHDIDAFAVVDAV